MKTGRRLRVVSVRQAFVLAVLGALLLALPAASSGRAIATSITVKVETPGGSVRSTPAGIDCPGTCSAVLAGPVELTAVPDSLWAFDKWKNGCESETGPTCKVAADAAVATTVSFQPAFALNVHVSGAGRVTSSPAGFDAATGKPASANCTAIALLANEPSPRAADEHCEIGYRAGQKVTLTARGIGGFEQKTWSRYHCRVAKPCVVTIEKPGTSVGASFSGSMLGVVVEGRGRVTSEPAGIDCGSTCVAAFAAGTKVRLTAAPGEDPFVEWFGSCGTAVVCEVTVEAPQIVAAGFGSAVTMIIPRLDEKADVSVDLGGLGSGAVALAGEESGSTTCREPHCTKRFDVTELVQLTATATAGVSRFRSWLGGCPPSRPSCEIDTRFITAVAACFAPLPPRDELGAVRVVKKSGKRRLQLAVRPGSKAAAVTVRLVRPGRSLALPAVRPSRLPATVSMLLPKSVPRGTYQVRASVDDAIGCRSDLKPRRVVVPRG